MKIPRNAISKAVESLLETDARQATVYLGPKAVVTATRRFKPDKRSKRVDLVLKLGAPNYREAQFINACFKAGEPLPVRKVQLKFWPNPKKRVEPRY